MTFEAKPVTTKAAADLSTKLYRCGKHTTTGINVCTVAGERVDGIIGSKPKAAGDGLDLFIDRLSPVEVGGVVAEGDELATDANGRAVKATEGQFVFGIASEAATGSGQSIAWRQVLSDPRTVQNISDTQLRPGQMGVFQFEIADAATADYDKIMTNKVEVLDVLVQKTVAGTGANANTVQAKSTAAAISDAISINAAADGDLKRAANITDANSVIAAAGILRISIVKAGGNAAVKVSVLCIGRA